MYPETGSCRKCRYDYLASHLKYANCARVSCLYNCLQSVRLRHPEGQLDVLLQLDVSQGGIAAVFVQQGQPCRSGPGCTGHRCLF